MRPNVSYELGLLRGKKKPLIILKSKDAEVSVKTFYQAGVDSGLNLTELEKLKNPKLNVQLHLSDIQGKHIQDFDKNALDDRPEHISNILQKELDAKLGIIMEEIEKIIFEKMSEKHEKLRSTFRELIKMYVT